jgi:putative tryptophan/tyrosine transport system substrate-binding protein
VHPHGAQRRVHVRAGRLNAGASVVIEPRFAEGNYDRLPALAAELVALTVDLVVASGSKAGVAASRATTTIPVVFSNMGDAINSGFVSNYAQPGGNVTGMSQLNPESAAKLLEYFKQVRPRSATVAALVNPANPNARPGLENQRRSAKAIGVALEAIEVLKPGELAGRRRSLSSRPRMLDDSSDPPFSV